MQIATRVRERATCGRLDGFETAILTAGPLEAAFVPGAGMAGVSLRHRGEELLDRQAGLRTYVQTGAVMGIPLLHPWANRLDGHGYALDGLRVALPPGPPLVHCEEHGLPIHGLLNASPHWRVTSHTPTRLGARLDFDRHRELLAAFPFPHVLELDAALAPDRLTIATTLRPTADVPVPIAFGFHPYLQIPGAVRREWLVSLPRRRHLRLDARSIPTGVTEHQPPRRFLFGDRVFDDGYDRLPEGARFGVAGGGRTVTVVLESGYPAGQVFAPEASEFICFEPMTAPTNALRSGAGLRRAMPGDAFTAVFSIRIQ